MRLRRILPAVALAALAFAGPWLAGPPQAPSVAPGAAQLLAPGTRIDEVPLAAGGFARARAIRSVAGTIEVLGADGWRTIPLAAAAEPKTRRAWLGTDQQGRDLLARTLAGARTSLLVALFAAALAIALGCGAGLAIGLGSPALRWPAGLVIDAALSVPRLLLVLALAGAAAGSALAPVLAIGCASWMEIARVVATAAAEARRRPYAVAAHALGASHARIAWRHVLPHLGPVLRAELPLVATEAVLLEATLGFLGVAGTSAASWGAIVADGRRMLPAGWWVALFPGLLLTLTAITFHRAARAGHADR